MKKKQDKVQGVSPTPGNCVLKQRHAGRNERHRGGAKTQTAGEGMATHAPVALVFATQKAMVGYQKKAGSSLVWCRTFSPLRQPFPGNKKAKLSKGLPHKWGPLLLAKGGGRGWECKKS